MHPPLFRVFLRQTQEWGQGQGRCYQSNRFHLTVCFVRVCFKIHVLIFALANMMQKKILKQKIPSLKMFFFVIKKVSPRKIETDS